MHTWVISCAAYFHATTNLCKWMRHTLGVERIVSDPIADLFALCAWLWWKVLFIHEFARNQKLHNENKIVQIEPVLTICIESRYNESLRRPPSINNKHKVNENCLNTSSIVPMELILIVKLKTFDSLNCVGCGNPLTLFWWDIWVFHKLLD